MHSDDRDTDPLGQPTNPDESPWRALRTRPCPDQRPQRPARCLGYREREPGRLQLRVALRGDEGVCDASVEEENGVVFVAMVVCCDADSDERPTSREFVNCPIHVYLDEPLGERSVIDVHTGQPVELFVPSW